MCATPQAHPTGSGIIPDCAPGVNLFIAYAFATLIATKASCSLQVSSAEVPYGQGGGVEHRHAGAAAALCGFWGDVSSTDDKTPAVSKAGTGARLHSPPFRQVLQCAIASSGTALTTAQFTLVLLYFTMSNIAM